MKLILLYITIINIIGFTLMGVDKKRAIRNAWRIPEATLFGTALLGGALGCTLGMRYFHHKTRHWYFKYKRSRSDRTRCCCPNVPDIQSNLRHIVQRGHHVVTITPPSLAYILLIPLVSIMIHS